MRRAAALAGSAAFLIVAPGTLAGLVPWAITGWRLAGAPVWRIGLGGVLIAAGAALLLECFVRFAVEGLGTPAPIAPPERLVVSGPYRRVRNPIYVAVVAMVLGQAVLFASLALAAYGAIFWLSCHTFVVLFEEPRLRRDFPDDYPAFAASVPRWLPRLF